MFKSTFNYAGKPGPLPTAEQQWIEGTAVHLDIPESESDDDYNDITDTAFNYLPNLETVFLPKNITSINKTAFANSPKLKSIVIAQNKTDKLSKDQPWGAPATCTVTYDPNATPQFTDVVSSVVVPSTTTTPVPTNYRTAMLELLQQMREYLNYINHPNFQLLNNGGIDIFMPDDDYNWKQEDIDKLYQTVDAVVVEDVFFGTDADYNEADDKATPDNIRKEFLEPMQTTLKKGLTTMVLDYCWTPANRTESQKLSKQYGFLCFDAASRELDTLDNGNIIDENSDDHYYLNDIKNYCAVLNSDKFTDPNSFETAAAKTNYDCFIIDINDSSGMITREQLKTLRTKPNGGRRVLLCYMSLGEAEVYRSYWNTKWSNYTTDDTSDPNYVAWKDAVSYCDWIDKPNPDWPGDFKVKYWTDEWKRILFGTNNSYLNLICDIGFDGVFLDVIDAYEYFEGDGATLKAKK